MTLIASPRLLYCIRGFLLLYLPSVQRKIFNLPDGTARPDGGFFN